MLRSVIIGSGSYIPPHVQSNNDFTQHVFYTDKQEPLNTSPLEIIQKFEEITGIAERRYTTDELSTSHIGMLAAREALTDSGTDP